MMMDIKFRVLVIALSRGWASSALSSLRMLKRQAMVYGIAP